MSLWASFHIDGINSLPSLSGRSLGCSSRPCSWPSTFTLCTKVKEFGVSVILTHSATTTLSWSRASFMDFVLFHWLGCFARSCAYCLICGLLQFYEPFVWRTNLISREMPTLSEQCFAAEGEAWDSIEFSAFNQILGVVPSPWKQIKKWLPRQCVLPLTQSGPSWAWVAPDWEWDLRAGQVEEWQDR